MRELVESNMEELVYGTDYATALGLFMCAAVGNGTGLNTIYV